jgi:hypothetical protein
LVVFMWRMAVMATITPIQSTMYKCVYTEEPVMQRTPPITPRPMRVSIPQVLV